MFLKGRQVSSLEGFIFEIWVLRASVFFFDHFVVEITLEQKHFSPLGTKPYLYVNSLKKNSVLLTTNMAALSIS